MALLYLFSFLSLVIIAPPTATATATANTSGASTITVPLSPFTKHPSSDPYQILNNLASSSRFRAHHLKRPKHKTNISDVVKTPVFPHSYGAYSISLSFGTPSQTLPFLMDTGSSLVWFPCTSRYVCRNCTFRNVDSSPIPTFMPKLSSSAKLLGCKNKKCSWIFGPDVKSRCQDCDPSARNCTQACPLYLLQYGSGATGGFLLLETLDFPQKSVPNFLVGCSIYSVRQPAGIAGFGRTQESLPSQMGLKKFAYCLVSRQFDDKPVGSNLVLETGSGSDDHKVRGISYTPFLENPVASNSVFQDFYYLTLRRIFIGDKRVNIPYRYLVPRSDGNGGTIVDSGSTFTFMERPVFEPMAKELEKQMSNYSRATAIENLSGLRPCFNISGKESVTVPELIFQFKGGAKMTLPLDNYFAIVADRSVVCLTIITDSEISPAVSGGPAIILGNFQQQNYYVEYDLANKRLGFVKRNCVKFHNQRTT